MNGEHPPVRATTALGRLLCHTTDRVDPGVKFLRCESREMCAGERRALGLMCALLLLMCGHHLLCAIGCHWLVAAALAAPVWMLLWIAAVVVIGLASTLAGRAVGRRCAVMVQNGVWFALLTAMAYVGLQGVTAYRWLGWLWFVMMLANLLAWIVVTLLGSKR